MTTSSIAPKENIGERVKETKRKRERAGNRRERQRERERADDKKGNESKMTEVVCGKIDGFITIQARLATPVRK